MVLKETEQPVEIPFEITMSGLGTFTEIEIQLPTNVNSNLVFDIDLIEEQTFPAFDPAAAGVTSQNLQFTFNSQSVILAYQNDEVIAARTYEAHASAALLHSGERISDLHMDTQGRANLIAKDSIFASLDNVNCTIAAITRGRIIGSMVKLKLEQLTQLVLSQLT